jgi:ATP-dependent RNA helicase DeaD
VERGFAAVALSGELTQAERNRALQALRDGRARVCVATDVAARGIDLPDLGLVLHAEIPRDRETLTHRSGRTGPGGQEGHGGAAGAASPPPRGGTPAAADALQVEWGTPPSAEEIRAATMNASPCRRGRRRMSSWRRRTPRSPARCRGA